MTQPRAVRTDPPIKAHARSLATTRSRARGARRAAIRAAPSKALARMGYTWSTTAATAIDDVADPPGTLLQGKPGGKLPITIGRPSALSALLVAALSTFAIALTMEWASRQGSVLSRRRGSNPPIASPFKHLTSKPELNGGSTMPISVPVALHSSNLASALHGETGANSLSHKAPTIPAPVTQAADVASHPALQPSAQPNGIAPREMPATSEHATLLREIRLRTRMTPRWPAHASAQAEKLRTYGPAYASMVVSHALRVVYVPVFKVATTSTMWQIAYMEGLEPVLQAQERHDGSIMHMLHDMGHTAWANHTVFRMRADALRDVLDDPSYLVFGFVRNPYDRLVSAFVDKVVRPDFKSYEYKRQLHGLCGTSDDACMTKFNSTKPTFAEFVHGVSAVLSEPRTRSDDVSSPDAYESNDSRRDLHWRPQTELLHPDLVHMDFVGRFESLEDDRQVVLHWMRRHSGRSMPHRAKRKLHSSDPGIKHSLFQQLREDPVLRNAVRQMYKDDFARFQYSTAVPDV